MDQTTLDLGKAVAMVLTTADTISVRILARAKLIIIDSARPLNFLGPLQIPSGKDLDK